MNYIYENKGLTNALLNLSRVLLANRKEISYDIVSNLVSSKVKILFYDLILESVGRHHNLRPDSGYSSGNGLVQSQSRSNISIDAELEIVLIFPTVSKTTKELVYTIEYVKNAVIDDSFLSEKKASQNKYKIIIGGELLTPLVQNSLLKVLEDSGVNYFFMCSTKDKFLDTVLSRSSVLKSLNGVGVENLLGGLEELQVEVLERFVRSRKNKIVRNQGKVDSFPKKNGGSSSGILGNEFLGNIISIGRLSEDGWKMNLSEKDISLIVKEVGRDGLKDFLRNLSEDIIGVRGGEEGAFYGFLEKNNFISRVDEAISYLENNCKVESVLYFLNE